MPPDAAACMPDIASSITASENGSVHQKRRRVSRSSGFSSAPAAGIAGSSAIPQSGQVPGWSWRICGCIGQV